MNDIKDEIKRIEKEQARLLKRKAALAEQMKRESEDDKKLDKLVEDSGMAPRALVKSLIDKYNLRFSGKAMAATGKTRKRTRMTAELRDEIKKVLASGKSMNATAKQFEISYAVIVKVSKGAYDKL